MEMKLRWSDEPQIAATDRYRSLLGLHEVDLLFSSGLSSSRLWLSVGGREGGGEKGLVCVHVVTLWVS